MTKATRLGWQQIEILKRVRDDPGLSTSKALEGLTRSNSPEKRLEEYGLIIDVGDNSRRQWHLTEAGAEELEKRDA